jgi:excisionase family DNA binding protein
MARDRLLTTGEAARALSIDRSTLARWEREGKVTPAFKTAGGHARWDLDDLKRQISEIPREGE